MNRHLLISAATAALIAGSSLAIAQTAPGAGGGSPGGASPGAAPQMGRDAPARGADSGMQRQGTDKAAPDSTNQRAQDTAPARKDGMAKDGMAKDATSKDGMSKDGMAKDAKGADGNRQTTGQAGAAGKLSTEQRSKITTVIKQQRVQPTTNINFSISVGTRVPRDNVRFYPLPTEIVTIYPDWRGYEFFMVGDEIIVVNPRTLEIVAVLDA
jgi:hypothetical protein